MRDLTICNRAGTAVFRAHFFLSLLAIAILYQPVKGQDTLRVMHYNMLLYGATNSGCTPNSTSVKNGFLKTIIDAVKPDIMAANELGPNSLHASNVHVSVLQTVNPAYERTTYTNNANSNVVNHLWFNGDKLGLVSEGYISQSLRDINWYKLYYKDANLAISGDSTFITAVVVHMKAGGSTSDANIRLGQSQAITNFLAGQGGPGNYILLGDLNLNTSSEASYQNLVANSNADINLFDPIGQSGTWSSNASFKDIHTQSTRANTIGDCGSSGGMDDRYDFILVSNQIMNNTDKVMYVPGTYKAYGNDGQHYNDNINTAPSNTAVNTAVANALYAMSDHLPVIMDIAIDGSANASNSPDYAAMPEIKAWPSPFEDHIELTISWNAIKNRKAKLELRDLTGRLLKVYKVKGATRLMISTNDLEAGMYLLTTRLANGNLHSQKLIKR